MTSPHYPKTQSVAGQWYRHRKRNDTTSHCSFEVERHIPASRGRLTRDLDCHYGYEPIDGIRAVNSDTLVMINADTRILEQPRDVVDSGMISISVERR